MAFYINNRNNGDISKKAASTAFEVGQFLQYDGSGYLVPATTGKVVGICNEAVSSASPDYAVARDLSISIPTQNDEIIIPVITGTATQALVGTLVNVDSSDTTGVDVTSGSHSQILVTRFINASTILGKIA